MNWRFALLCLALSCATPAHAALTVCNTTQGNVSVALGRYDGSKWISEGWWSVPAAHCTAVVNKPLIARYYYLYADDGKGGWAGHHAFCVGTPGKPFRIRGRGNCALSGFERKDFFEIDTGNDTDFQQTLSD